MSSSERSQPQNIIMEQEYSSGQTSEEKRLTLSLRRLGFDLKPGHSGKGEALRWAIRKGYSEQVQLLLRCGPNDEALRDTDQWGSTAAHYAVLSNRPELLRALLEAGADVSLMDHQGFTPFLLSAKEGHCQVAKLLLANGSDPSWADGGGLTAAVAAAMLNHSDMLQILAFAGDDLSRVYEDGNSLLHRAAYGGAQQAFEMLVKTRARTMRWRNVTGHTPLHVAVVNSSLGMVKHVLAVATDQRFQDTSLDIDSLTFDSDGITPLHAAAILGKREVVELLLDNGANIDTTNLMERTALHLAAHDGHSEVVRTLVHRGADVNARHRGPRSYAIHDAVLSGDTKTLSALLEGGALLTSVTEDGYTALHVAVGKGHLGILRRLLQENSPLEINAVGYGELTPLIAAVALGTVDTARLLLEYGASTSTPDSIPSRASMPLHWAVSSKRPRMVKLLLEHGANPAAQSFDGECALSRARRSLEGQALEEIEELFRAAEGVSGRGPIMMALRQLLSASKSGNLDLITTLLQDQRIDINLADEDGYTSLLTASENGKADVVRLLLRMGADMDAKNASGESSIWLASRFGHEAIVQTLLESGAGVNSADELNQTAISAAIEGRHPEVVGFLLANGADLGIRTSYGKTAHMFAVDSGCEVIVNALPIHVTKSLPQAPVDMRTATALEGDLERGVSEVDSDRGAPPDLPQTDGSNLEIQMSTQYVCDGPGVHDVASVHWSDGDGAEDTDFKDTFVKMAERGRNAAVNRIIRAGHGIEGKDRRGVHALGSAAAMGRMSTVRTLLDYGFDPNLKDDLGRTALAWAAMEGRREVAQVLLESGGKIGTASVEDSTSPLIVAVEHGHVRVLEILLTAGDKKEVNNNEGLLALKVGATSGHVQVVEHLIESGVNVEAEANSEETPLTLAVAKGEAKIVHLLLQAGAAMRTLSANVSLLCVAAELGHEDVVKILLEHGADVDQFSERGWTPLIHAASSGNDTVARVLLEVGGAKLYHRDENNLTAQSYAKWRGHEGVAALLRHASRLRRGASPTSSSLDWRNYIYTPLSGPSCIRVLDLHPGLEHEAVSFDLYEIDIDSRHSSRHSYKALSYEWKGELPSVIVQCNSRSLFVTPNLRLALQNIRSREETQTLWVDAICINQNDADERSSQVLIMAKIYRQAKSVLMWLEKDSPEIEEAVACIPAVLYAWTQFAERDVFDYMHSGDTRRNAQLCSRVLTAAGRDIIHSSQVDDGVKDILRRSYFTRAWIYQEMFLASARGLIIFRHLRVYWRDLVRFIYIWTQGTLDNRWRTREHATFSNILMASMSNEKLGHVHIKHALEAMTKLSCSDPRDKIFAVLGTVDSSWSVELAPNYHLPVKQVYVNAARALIRRGRFSFWNRIHHPTTNQIPDLPSWVPDWTCVSARYLELNDGAILRSLFAHPRERGVPQLVSSQCSTTETVLSADGYVIGEVAFSVTMRAGEDIYDTIVRPLVEGLATIGTGIFDRCPCTESLSYLSVFCRFVCSSSKLKEASLDFDKSHEAYLTRKIMADPSTAEKSRKVPPELEPAWQECTSQSQLGNSQFSQEDHKICSEMEERLLESLSACNADSGGMLPSCDLYCTRSGYLGVAGEGIAERHLILALLEEYESVAMLRKQQNAVEGDCYEFVGGADILELDWKSFQTLEDLPMDGQLKRFEIL